MLTLLTAGESHGPGLTAILAGMPAGLLINEALIAKDLARRQIALGAGGRMAIEQDHAQILAGVMAGKTTGAPISLFIANRDHENWKERKVSAYVTPRPGHADLAAAVKYGFDDIRPSLERASARETACRVAAGAICRKFLETFDIRIEGKIASIGSIKLDPPVSADALPPTVVDAIAAARNEGETLGGIIQVTATGLPIGLGSYVTPDRRLDGRLAQAVLSVPAIKGFEIGEGFLSTTLPGTSVHDAIRSENGKFTRPTNRCGGLEGGVTNGEPLWFRAAMKPIPTCLKGIETVNLATNESCVTKYERSDVSPVPRAVVVLEAVTALVLADALIEKLGGDSITEMQERWKTLPQKAKVNGSSKIFWGK